jgi:hypothetical protein
MSIYRKIIYLLLSTVTTLIILGCTKKKHVNYHSTASIPHSMSSNLTIMKYIGLDNSSYSHYQQYGVATAVDIKDDASQVRYILFAPYAKKRHVKNLDDMLMSMSVPLTTDQAKTLTKKLKVLIGNWGKALDENGAIFYKFSITPEHKQKQISKNVISQQFVFEFSFSQFPKKKAAVNLMTLDEIIFGQDQSFTDVNLTIGRDNYFKTIKIDKKENLQVLIYLLDQAVKDIADQIGKELKLPLKTDT